VSQNEPARASPPEYHYLLDCPCGMTLEGGSEDEIVERSFAHLREVHPTMADTYERHHILFMARRMRA
jgi:hypothetical protein